MGRPEFIETARLILRGLEPTDANREYLCWLNDPEVLRYRGPKAFPTTLAALVRYVEGIGDRGDLMLAICLKDSGRHIGNITLNTILWVHRSAELSMMIGARDQWGQKYAQEAIHGLCSHGFRNMGLLRIWAESPNPAFNAAVRAVGFHHEGTKRKAFLLDGGWTDIECWGLLKDEFAPRPALEKP